MTYTRIPVELILRYAGGADHIYVKYEKLSTRQTRRGGIYVRGDPQERYIQLRSAWQYDPKRKGEKVLFSVQVNDDTAFMVDKRVAEMLQARGRYPVPPMVPIYRPPSPFTAAGYGSDLSEMEEEENEEDKTARFRHGSPNIDGDELYYHSGGPLLERKIGTDSNAIPISDEDDEPHR